METGIRILTREIVLPEQEITTVNYSTMPPGREIILPDYPIGMLTWEIIGIYYKIAPMG